MDRNSQPKPQKKLTIIDPQAAVNAMNMVQQGKFGALPSSAFEIEAYEVPPLPGFEEAQDFPDCCPYHRHIVKIGKERFDLFPDCCVAHKRLHTAHWFKKQKYSYLPIKLVTSLAYTKHCILASFEKPDWYKEITDYIAEMKSSYGQLPDGYGPPVGLELYTFNLQKYIESEDEIPVEKKEALIQYLESYKQTKKPVEPVDLNLLIDTYRRWLKLFPFQISFFKHLKPFFEKQLPFLKGTGNTNMYSGMTTFELVSNQELIGFLVSTTLSIIKEINTYKLSELGLLKEPDAIKMELILGRRKLELEELDRSDWEERKQYIKLLKQWMTGEKKFLSELKPFLNAIQHPEFIQDLLDGMHLLQRNDSNEPCIMNVRENRPDKETSFRYWFRNFFTARYPLAVITAEEQKGSGRIDLKIVEKKFGDKIIEFKGWWNRDKVEISQQICEYLTDFEDVGYVFMINDRKKNIQEDYLKIITSTKAQYVFDTLKTHHAAGGVTYFQTGHRFGPMTKTLYHFIFNVW